MTVVMLVPILFPEEHRPTFLNPEEAKKKLDSFLAAGYRIKLMNDFVYHDVVFTHYVLEKEQVNEKEQGVFGGPDRGVVR